MAKTGIEWTEATWNPIVGCSVVSPGCTNCYAMTMAARLEAMGTLPHYAGTTQKTKAGPVWTGKLALAPEATLLAPLRRRKPTTWFVNSMGDLFHDDVPDEWIDRVFAVMALTPQHTYQVLTKRSARMRAYLSDLRVVGRIARVLLDAVIEGSVPTSDMAKASWPVISIGADIDEPDDVMLRAWPLRNVWLGVSAEDQRRADERIPDLLATPAAIHFVSAEPLRGPIDFAKWLSGSYECAAECGWRSGNAPAREICHSCGLTSEAFGEFCTCGSQDFGAICPNCESNAVQHHPDTPNLDWIIVGGESGKGARPMHPGWVRSIRDECAAAGTAFFFKQWGAWSPLANAHPVDEAGGRTCSVAWPDGTISPGSAAERGGRGTALYVATKKWAGRLLDGAEHNAMPQVAP